MVLSDDAGSCLTHSLPSFYNMNSDMIQKEKAATFISYISSFKIFSDFGLVIFKIWSGFVFFDQI